MNGITKVREEQQIKLQVEPPASESAAIMHVIERAATNPEVDIDKMERLFAMHERVKEREAKRAFDEALANAKAEMTTVVRNKRNDQTRSNYADLAAISEMADPILARHGFSLSFGTDKSALDNHYGVTCELTHIGGHSRSYRADIPSTTTGMKGNANMTPTHAFGSAMSYGRRYLKCLICDIATSDDDGNAAGKKQEDLTPITAEQRDRILNLIDKTKSDVKKFCKQMGIEAVAHLPLTKYGNAEALLLKKQAMLAKQEASQ